MSILGPAHGLWDAYTNMKGGIAADARQEVSAMLEQLHEVHQSRGDIEALQEQLAAKLSELTGVELVNTESPTPVEPGIVMTGDEAAEALAAEEAEAQAQAAAAEAEAAAQEAEIKAKAPAKKAAPKKAKKAATTKAETKGS